MGLQHRRNAHEQSRSLSPDTRLAARRWLCSPWPVFGSVRASAQTSIVALVNNTPITSTEVSERRALIRLTQKKNLDARQALDQLIDSTLLFQEAKRRQITIPEADVDQRFAGIAANTKLGVDKLGQVLAQAGASTRAFKSEIRSGLLQRKMMGMLARTATGISEKEIAAGITAKKSEGEGARSATRCSRWCSSPPRDRRRADQSAQDGG